MKLLSQSGTTAVSTFGGSTFSFGGQGTGAANLGPGSHRIDAIQVIGDSSIAGGGIVFRYGRSSGGGFTSMVVCQANSSVLNFRADGLGLVASVWKFLSPPTAGGMGWVASVYGN